MKIDEQLTDSRNQQLEAYDVGAQASANILGERQAETRRTQFAAADDSWRKLADPGKVTWGKDDYDYRSAYCAGVDLEKDELPNRYFSPNARNVAGYDLASGAPVKPVVDRQYEGNAYYGVGELSRSRRTVGGVMPTEDIVGLSSVGAAMQASGATYEEFAAAHRDYSDPQLKRSWQAGTESLRMQEIERRIDEYYPGQGRGKAAYIGIYAPDAKKMDFDVRMADPAFQKAGRVIYKNLMNADYQGTDAAAARWLAERMRDIDWWTPMWAVMAQRIMKAGPDVHQAYATALEAWGQTNMEMALMPQVYNATRVFADPVTYFGMGVGKIALTAAGHLAFKEFVQRLLIGGATGAVQGATGATLKANLQGRDPTGAEMGKAAIESGLGMGAGNAVLPPALTYLGRKIVSGIKSLRSPDMPPIPAANVRPLALGAPVREGELIPGERSIRAGEDPMPPLDPADIHPQGETPEGYRARLANLEREGALEQQPYDGGPGIEPPEGHGMGPAMNPDASPEELAMEQAWNAFKATDHGLNQFEMAAIRSDLDAGGLTIEARQALQRSTSGWMILDLAEGRVPDKPAMELPPLVAPPPLPRDPTSRVLIDPSTGYYSTSQKAVAEFGKGEAPASEWRAVMDKAPNRRLDEIAWLDMEKLYKKYGEKKPIPKEAVQDWIDERMIKIQRYPLVLQNRRTQPIGEHLLNTNDAYARLSQEQIALEDKAVALRADIAANAPPGTDYLTEIIALRTPAHAQLLELGAQREELISHMQRVADEERKLMIETGSVPPGIHSIEHIIEHDRTGAVQGALENMAVWTETLSKWEAVRANARTDASRLRADQTIAAAENALRQSWFDIEVEARRMGAIVRPQDLDRAMGYIKYGDPQMRGASLVGRDEPGAQVRNGIDPLGHQIALHIHPEGLKAKGAEWHPGGPTPGVTGWAITSERNFADGSSIRFVDEGQNDLVKARRTAVQTFNAIKANLKPTDTSEQASAIFDANTYDDWVWARYRHEKLSRTPDSRMARTEARLPEHWEGVSAKQRLDMMQDPIWMEPIWHTNSYDPELVALPKQLFFPTALSNIFKSELFNAAREGKDWFGWTTVETIHARLPENAPQYMEGMYRFIPDAHFDRLNVNVAGPRPARRGVYSIMTFEEAYALADKMDKAGGDGAPLRKLTSTVEAYREQTDVMPILHSVTLNLPKVEFKPGKLLHYDVQTKQDMEKFAKSLGGKVVKKDMPLAPGSPHIATGWFIKLSGEDGIGAKLLKGGVPLGAVAAGAVGVETQQEEQ